MTTTAPPQVAGRFDTASTDAGTRSGLGLLVRLAIRRGRWFWLTWILALWVTIVATVTNYERFVPNDAAGAHTLLSGLAENPTMRAMLGPPFDLFNAGGFTMWRVGGFVAVMAGIMAALGVIRATRAEEEEGRLELLRSGVVGRHAPLLAGVLVGLGGSGVLGVAVTASLAAAAPPATSALAAGAGIALTAAVFVGVAAVTAQITESARAARSLALGALGAAYLVRAVADGSPDGSGLRALAWLSPVEWAALAQPYAGERWWVLLLPAGLAAALVSLAFRLESRRDFGSGLRATRPGPRTASPRLAGATGLAWRLDRGTVVGWAIGSAVFALAIGSLSGSFDTLLTDNPEMSEMFRRMGAGAQDLRDAFYVAMLGIFVIVLAMHGTQLLSRCRREEESGRAEALLATATSRRRLVASHLVLALVVPTLLVLVCGALFAVPQAISDGSLEIVGTVAGAALALAPGVWLIVGLTMALLGLAPRLLSLAWAVVGWSLFVTWVGAVLNLPDWALQATPFAALPQLPVEPMAWTPVLLETALAAGLVAVGIAGYRRRDIG